MRFIALGLAATTTVASAQQPLERRLAAAPDGAVRLSYATRAGVCGDGCSFIADGTAGPHGFRTFVFQGDVYTGTDSPDWRAACLPGPAWVILFKTGPRISRLDVFVGPELRVTTRGTDLGSVGAAEAAGWLLDLAESAPADQVTSRAFLAATLADSVRLTERLARVARNRERASYVRERAARWLPDVAEREGATAAADAALRGIVGDDGDVPAVRERAIRALAATPDNDAFLRQLYPRLGRTELKERVIRRLGESWGDQNTRWIRALALERIEALALRERAIRVLGEEQGQHDQLMALYRELADVSLKERVIRVVGDDAGTAAMQWLRSIVEDRTEHSILRERALRVLGEQGDAAYLRDIYPRLDAGPLQERVIRAVAERQGPGAADWLLQRVLDRAEQHGLRDRALRAWAESVASPELRALYPRLDDDGLRDRLLRIGGERGEGAWLREVAADASQAPPIRDRAVRVLAETGSSTEELIRLYDTSGSRALQERLVRLLAERSDVEAVDKLIAIARSDPDADLRRLAVRRLSESGHPRAQSFLQEMLRR